MSLQSLMCRQPPPDVIVPYSWMAKFLKIPIFRLSLGDDFVSKTAILIYNLIHSFFSRLCHGKNRSFRSFDPSIAQKSINRFEALGANIHFVVPRDKKGKIQMMTFRAEDLEQKIEALGGSWQRRNIQGKEVFAIVPPQHAGAEWLNFKEKLNHFHWREEEGMIVTCECADVIPLNAVKQCFLYAHSTGISFASDWKRAGFYIGAKQDLCFFDNGNTWKNNGRPPSEESFYLEIEAAHDKIRDEYPIDCLWIGGSCGGVPVAAYLKSLFHDQGVNFFAEQSFPDLDDFINPISPFLTPRIKGTLNDQPLPENMQHCPPACQFSAIKLWENLHRYEDPKKGKFILVQVRDDEHISEQAYARYLTLANNINANVKHLLYSSTASWHHADNFFRYEVPSREFIKAVFN